MGMASPILPNPEAAASPRQLNGLADELWEEIFLRVASPSNLARASTACASFHRLIADPSFLRRCYSIHPPLLLGLICGEGSQFVPIEAPHPNAPVARALARAAGFTFDYLPRATWYPCDVRDGRVLLESLPELEEDGYLLPDFALCEPLFRRCLLLPRIPEDLAASVGSQPKCIAPSLLPPGHEEEDASFRVMNTVYSVEKLAVFIFSSGSGCWNIVKSATWDALNLSLPPGDDLPLSHHNDYAYGCFYWKVFGTNKLLKFNINSLEFCTVDFLLDHNKMRQSVIAEAGEARLGMFSLTDNGDSLYYTTRQKWRTDVQ